MYAQGKKGSQILYLSVNPNGEAEKVNVFLRSQAKLRKTKFEIDFADLAVKGQLVKGNLVTKYPVRRVELAEKGVSTLSAREIWLDEAVMRLNDEGRGRSLGKFHGDDRILEITRGGEVRLLSYDLATHFEPDSPVIEKWNPRHPVSMVYYDGEKKKYYVKRFLIDRSQKPETVISQAKGSHLAFVSTDVLPVISVSFAREKGVPPRENLRVELAEFIAVKGIRAQGNQLSPDKVKAITPLPSLPYQEPEEDEEEEADELDDRLEETADDLQDGQVSSPEELSPADLPESDGEGSGAPLPEDASEQVGDGGQTSLF